MKKENISQGPTPGAKGPTPGAKGPTPGAKGPTPGAKLSGFLFLLSIFLFLPFVSFAQTDPTQCFLASGFGDSSANGTYVYTTDTTYASIEFSNSTGFLLFNGLQSSHWPTTADYIQSTSDANNFYADLTPSGSFTTDTWGNYGDSASPAGTVSLTTCPPLPSPPSRESEIFASTTMNGSPIVNYEIVDNPNADYFDGMVVYFWCLTFIIWFFRKKS